jgi:GNAT superfamily N-acetyltransferase
VTVRTRTLADAPRLEGVMHRLHRVAWPPFLRDDAVNALWPRLYTDFPHFQLALEAPGRRVVAIGNSIPFAWNGTRRGLPDRLADVLARAIRGRERGTKATALVALAAIVDPRHRGTGLSARVVRAMARLAAAWGLRALLAPVRPASKGDYPLTPMREYAAWRRGDGLPFDPWLRVHSRLGACVLRVTPRGNTVRARVGEWEEWTGLRFPASGRYVVPGAFQPIRVDRRRDRVHYEEANVWMLHRVPRRPIPRPATRHPVSRATRAEGA